MTHPADTVQAPFRAGPPVRSLADVQRIEAAMPLEQAMPVRSTRLRNTKAPM